MSFFCLFFFNQRNARNARGEPPSILGKRRPTEVSPRTRSHVMSGGNFSPFDGEPQLVVRRKQPAFPSMASFVGFSRRSERFPLAAFAFSKPSWRLSGAHVRFSCVGLSRLSQTRFDFYFPVWTASVFGNVWTPRIHACFTTSPGGSVELPVGVPDRML